MGTNERIKTGKQTHSLIEIEICEGARDMSTLNDYRRRPNLNHGLTLSAR